MKKRAISSGVLALATILLFSKPTLSLSETESEQGKRSLTTIKKELRKLKKLVRKNGVRGDISNAAAKIHEFDDSDDDGLPDILENVEGTDACGHDSDSDGITDGDEEKSDSNPDDSQESEVEFTGLVTSVTSTTVTVGNYTFTVTDASTFKKVPGLSSVNVGDRVEVSGRTIDGVLTLKKLAVED